MAEVHIPHDVLFNHILPRLPPKSIGSFRCVSKEWHSLLTSDMFQNKHIHHHRNNIKLMLFLETWSSFEFTTIDCEAPPTDDNGLTPTRQTIPKFGDTTYPCDIRVLTSCHGLVCLGMIRDPDFYLCDENDDFQYSDLILWNPVTNEYKRLSKSVFGRPYNTTMIFGLYYSSTDDDYKLLSIQKFHHYVYIYSLKSDSWRKVDAFQGAHILNHWGLSRGTYLNENLYFLQHHESNRQLPSIIKFDTKNERLSMIETPNVDEAYCYFATIVVKSDCIHLCVKYDTDHTFGNATNIELWKLDEYDTKTERLSMVETIQLRPMQPRPLYVFPFLSVLDPFYIMKNRNWLMMENTGCYYRHKIYKVHLINDDDDDDSESAIKVRVGSKYKVVLREGRYIETFVSPNRYMK